jgi:hypothetical protein
LTGFLGGIEGVTAPVSGATDFVVIAGPGGSLALTIALGIIVVTCAVTIVQRIVHVQRQATHR